MLLGDVIKKYRSDKKLSLRAFADKCNLSYTYISMLEKNSDYRTGKPIAPTLDSVKNIANAMGMTIDELLKILDDEQELKLTDMSDKLFLVPVYGKISAGQPNWAEECLNGYLPVDPNLMNILNPEEYFFLRVDGESMNEVIKNGAYALIHKTDYVDDGEIAVVLVNGFDATLKKFTIQENFIVLEPMSTDKTIKQQIYDKNTPIKIIGKYVGKFEINN